VRAVWQEPVAPNSGRLIDLAKEATGQDLQDALRSRSR
jgi:hypothetical protein